MSCPLMNMWNMHSDSKLKLQNNETTNNEVSCTQMFSFHTYKMLLSLPKWGENKNLFSTIRHWRYIWNKLSNMWQTITREETAVWCVLDQWTLGSLQCKCWKCSVSHHFSLDHVKRLNVWTKMNWTWWMSKVKFNGHARSNRNLVNLKFIRTMTLEVEGSARGQHHICLLLKKAWKNNISRHWKSRQT